MHIPSNVDELLLTPMLNGELAKPIFNIRFEQDEEEIDLHAFLTRESNEGPFQLTIHSPKGKDFHHLFSNKSRMVREDVTSATAVLDGKLEIEMPCIFRPHSRNLQGEHRSANITLSELNIPVVGWDGMTKPEKVKALGGEPKAEAECSKQSPKFDHLALIPNVEIQFSNDSIKTEQEHNFWGYKSKGEGKLLNGELFDAEYSIRSYGEHILIGLKHREESAEIAEKKFASLIKAVAFSHACQPWPAYEIVWQDGRIIKHHLHARSQVQGKFTPLRDFTQYMDKEAPHRLISSTAEFLYQVPPKEADKLANSLWIFRSADNEAAPLPLQQAMICGIIESLRDLFSPPQAAIEEPTEFNDIKSALKSYTKELKQQFPEKSHTEHINSLKILVGNFKFNYQTQLKIWEGAFFPLFPTNKEYVQSQWKNFKDLRNSVAHGDYSFKTDRPHEQMRKVGELAAFVNAIIAAKAGYTGDLKSNVWGNETIGLKCQHS